MYKSAGDIYYEAPYESKVLTKHTPASQKMNFQDRPLIFY